VAAPTPPAQGSNAKWIVVGVLAVAVLALGAFLLLGRDSGKKNNVAAASSSSNSTSDSASASTSASSSSTRSFTEAELQARLITAKELGTNFAVDIYRRNTDASTPCGTANPDRSAPPTIDVGSVAKTTTGIRFEQEIGQFADAATAQRAFDLDIGGFSCTQGSIVSTGSSSSTQTTLTFQRPQDRSSELNVEKAVEIDFQANGFHGQLFFVRMSAVVVQFVFQTVDSADTSTVPDASSVVRHALDRLAS
jgi:hypothetical protein